MVTKVQKQPLPAHCTAPHRVICPLNHNNAGLWSLNSVSDSIQFSIAEIVEKK